MRRRYWDGEMDRLGNVFCLDCGELVAREHMCRDCSEEFGETICRDCCDCQLDELFDADELGLDPDQDDERRYKPI